MKIIKKPYYQASVNDIEFLVGLEGQVFDEDRQASPKQLLRGIGSSHQLIVIREDDQGCPCGAITIRLYKHTLRILSIGVLKECQGKGFGLDLLKLAESLATYGNYERMTLEAESNDDQLLEWYEDYGFKVHEDLDDYYGSNRHAVRMVLDLKKPCINLLVTDYETDFFDEFRHVRVVSAEKFLKDRILHRGENIRIINMCKSFAEGTRGYKVALLAWERGQRATPDIRLIREINQLDGGGRVKGELDPAIQACLQEEGSWAVTIHGLFEASDQEKFSKLIGWMGHTYKAPLIRYTFIKEEEWVLKSLELMSLKEALSLVGDDLYGYAEGYLK